MPRAFDHFAEARRDDGRRPTLGFLVRHPAHFIALGFGAGLAPFAPGTFGTLLAIPIAAALWTYAGDVGFIVAIGVLFGVGVWASAVTGRDLGVPDHGAIVWDEVVAFLLVLFFVGERRRARRVRIRAVPAFDIVKPPPIRQLDAALKNGFGVMADDILAAGYTLLVFALWQRVGRMSVRARLANHVGSTRAGSRKRASTRSDAEPAFHDGWLLRLSPGKAKRARSVNAHFGSTLPLPAKIEYCENLYRRHGLPTLFRISAVLATAGSRPGPRGARLAAFEPRSCRRRRSVRGRTRCVADGVALTAPMSEFVDVVGDLRGSSAEQRAAHRERLEISAAGQAHDRRPRRRPVACAARSSSTTISPVSTTW